MSRIMSFLSLALVLAFASLAQPAARSELGAVASTPPMGWNSYDYYNWTVNESEVMANANWLAKNVRPYGWNYVVVDFLWFKPFLDNYGLNQFKNGRPMYQSEHGSLWTPFA